MKKNTSTPIIIAEMMQLIRENHGINLDGINKNLLLRRLELLTLKHKITSVNDLMNILMHQSETSSNIIQQITPSVTGMFRDPGLFLRLDRVIVNQKLDKQTIRIWHVGCAEGLEVFSMAIRLAEVGLLTQSVLYGTDINEYALKKANKGIVPLSEFKNYSANYLAAGGTNSLSDYFTISYDQAILKQHLRNKIFIGKQQLGLKENFQKHQLVLCRNLLYYYNLAEQNMLLDELVDSMVDDGIICFGINENIENLTASINLKCLDAQYRIYQKLKG
jgi:chemotaxis protein methyltransferase CheR